MPAKSDSVVMFVNIVIRGLKSINHLCFALALVECKVKVLLNICKQNITSLSLLVGTTVTLVVLNVGTSSFQNNVDLDQLAAEEANWSGSIVYHAACKSAIINVILQFKWLENRSVFSRQGSGHLSLFATALNKKK